MKPTLLFLAGVTGIMALALWEITPALTEASVQWNQIGGMQISKLSAVP